MGAKVEFKNNGKDKNFFISIVLLTKCNFKCPYCYTTYPLYNIKSFLNRPKNKFRDVEIEEIAKTFDKIKRNNVIVIDGGEPFLFPRFIELCKLLTRNNRIQILTNMTHKNIKRFADEVNPKGVRFIRATLHIEELEKHNLIQQFIDNFYYLKNKGFKVTVRYVMYPPYFRRFKTDYELFKSKGITIEPKPFEGHYHLRKYPQAYTKKQKQLIKDYSTPHLDKYLKKGIVESSRNFKDRKCLAGVNSIHIKTDGSVYRCRDDKKSLGNLISGRVRILDKPEKCRIRTCPCLGIGIMSTGLIEE